jgi:hypothetical protein
MTSMLDAKAMGPMLSRGKDNGPDAKSSLGLLNAAGSRTSRKIRSERGRLRILGCPGPRHLFYGTFWLKYHFHYGYGGRDPMGDPMESHGIRLRTYPQLLGIPITSCGGVFIGETRP